jgi:hypothetical protein
MLERSPIALLADDRIHAGDIAIGKLYGSLVKSALDAPQRGQTQSSG